MKKNLRVTIITSIVLFTASLFLMSFDVFPGGYVGTTKKGGVNLGCVCHGGSPTTGVSVFFSGPDSVAVGQTVTYIISVARGPAIVGGFNVASGTGAINVAAGDTTVRKQDGELTHARTKPFTNDTVRWSFTYTAPSSAMMDTLFATGNSTNNDNSTENDQWNWSSNRLVRVYNPIGIISLSTVAGEFSLSQNYPNPFNPVTQIRFSVARSSNVQIIVYDMLGNIAAIPVNENLKQGEYSADFNGAQLASGAYFYSLVINGEKVSTKKMLLLK